MNPLPKKNILESVIQKEIMDHLTLQSWYCVKTHGNEYQSGFPDIFAASRRFGIRWIEVKRPIGYRFTSSQLTVFTKFASKNVGVWILTHKEQYDRLFTHSNWHTYIKGGIVLKDDVKRIKKYGPEGLIQDAIINKLTSQGWFCIETYGNIYQSGLPDIFVCHEKYGTRWIECKNILNYRFTPAQMDVFPSLTAFGVGIWILVSDSDDELAKLFKPPNWYTFL